MVCPSPCRSETLSCTPYIFNAVESWLEASVIDPLTYLSVFFFLSSTRYYDCYSYLDQS